MVVMLVFYFSHLFYLSHLSHIFLTSGIRELLEDTWKNIAQKLLPHIANTKLHWILVRGATTIWEEEPPFPLYKIGQQYNGGHKEWYKSIFYFKKNCCCSWLFYMDYIELDLCWRSTCKGLCVIFHMGEIIGTKHVSPNPSALWEDYSLRLGYNESHQSEHDLATMMWRLIVVGT